MPESVDALSHFPGAKKLKQIIWKCTWMSQIVWSQEISIPTPRRVTKNSEGGGSQKPKYSEETLKPTWNLQELEGSTQNLFNGGGRGAATFPEPLLFPSPGGLGDGKRRDLQSGMRSPPLPCPLGQVFGLSPSTPWVGVYISWNKTLQWSMWA